MTTTALITGANRGIGLELCRQLHARGTQVIAVCRKSSPELDALGTRVLPDVDITAEASIQRLVHELRGNTIDLLINNAGLLHRDNLSQLNFPQLRAQMEVNAWAPLFVTHALLPCLQKGAKVALITSRMGSIADNTSGGYYGYRMSKAALNAAGVSLAVDLKPRGIAVVMLHPGYVSTGMTQNQGDVTPAEAATQLLSRMDELTLEKTGQFLHANGQILPW